MRNHRHILLFVAAALLTLVFWGHSYAAHASSSEMTGCIDECKTCQTSCEKLLASAKKSGDQDHVKLLGDCASMCKTSSDFMSRGSQFHVQVCKLCSQICQKCATSCDKQKDKASKDCADECRKCASSCTKMAG